MSRNKFSHSGCAYWLALLVSLLSILSHAEKPTREVEGVAYMLQWAQYQLYDNRLLIGLSAVAIIIIGWILGKFLSRPQSLRTDVILSALHKEIRIVPPNEVQVSYFNIQKGIWIFGKYLANIFWLSLSWKNIKNGLWWLYVTHKFPKFSKNYLVKTNQFRTMTSHRRPYIYFQMTNDEKELNGFVSYCLVTPTCNSIKTNNLYMFDESKKRIEEYPTNAQQSINAYLKKMHMSYNDLRCIHTLANYLHVEVISDRESNYIGALVIDIKHAGRDLYTDDKSFIDTVAKYTEFLYYSENYI